MWQQKHVKLDEKPRGFHLITNEIIQKVPEICAMRYGVAHFFIRHTSASLSINENADPTVRSDLEAHLNQMVPENAPYYEHTDEGPDDMPAHIKASLLGNSVSIPIEQGKLALGTWQGVYLGEHRKQGGSREVIVTLHGERT